MIKGYKFLKGYLKLDISGKNIERFLNMAIKKRIFIWDIKRLKNDRVQFCVSNEGYSFMEDIAAETGALVTIISTHGIKELAKTYKKRRYFFIFAAVVLAVILISSSFIWEVAVEKQNFIDETLIKSKLAGQGLKPWAFRQNIDYDRVANEIITEFPEVLWAAIELSGTKLIVRLAPRKIAPPLIPKDVPTNIVAKRDAAITSIITENGDAKARAGDTVLKGQVLISGAIPNLHTGTRYLHSIGKIEGITWYEKKIPKKLYIYNKIKTGNVDKKRYLYLPFIKIPLQFNETIDFYNYDSIIKENTYFFITHKEFTYEEYNLKRENISLEKAVDDAVLEADEYIKNEGITNIISKKVNYEALDEENIDVTVMLECKEEIGEEMSIDTSS